MRSGGTDAAGFHAGALRISSPPFDRLVEDPAYVVTPLFTREQGLMVAPGNSLSIHAVEDLARTGARFVNRQRGSGTRAMVEDYLAEHGLAPVALTLGSNGAIKHAAHAGLGVSLQSRLAVQLELAQGRLATIALREPPAAREWYVIRAATGPVHEATDAFMSFVTSRAARDTLSIPGT